MQLNLRLNDFAFNSRLFSIYIDAPIKFPFEGIQLDFALKRAK
jgi:hypothetical protein